MKGIFVTGTDTGVGKTVVARAIAAAARARDIDVAVYKPVETGCRRQGDRLVGADVEALTAAAGSDQEPELTCGYLFELPAAPLVAAEQAETSIDPDRIVDAVEALGDSHDFVIVEGAGGLMVPVTHDTTWIELIDEIELPVVCVVANRLGCINHALLTLAMLDNEALDCRGFVMSEVTAAGVGAEAGPDPSRATNRATIEAFTDVPCLGTLPHLGDAELGDSAALARTAEEHLDLNAILGVREAD